MRFILPLAATLLALSTAQAADVPYNFNSGTVASSANVNADFAFLSGRITTLESASQTTVAPITPVTATPTYGHVPSVTIPSTFAAAGQFYSMVALPAPGPYNMTLTVPVPQSGTLVFTVIPISAAGATGQFVITGHNAWCPNGIQFSRSVSVNAASVSYVTTATAELLIQLDAANAADITLTATTATLRFTDPNNTGNFTAPVNYTAINNKVTTETTAYLTTAVNTLIGLVTVQ